MPDLRVNLVTHLTENGEAFLFRARRGGEVFKGPRNAADGKRKDGAILLGTVTDRDDVGECLSQQRRGAFVLQVVSPKTSFLQHFDSQWVQPTGFQSCGSHVEPASGVLLQQSLGHLGTGRIPGADK